MADTENKLPASKEATPPTGIFDWSPLESFRRQFDRFFDDFPSRRSLLDLHPLERLTSAFPASPPVDFVEKDGEYEISAELPGLDEKSVDVKLSNGVLTISGEKKEEKEEKKEGYYFSERRYGSFRRAFRVPEGVDADKIAATFEKGVLKITLPKTAEAKQQEKKIEIAAK
ncbi:Hsp20/alpha crystallin family protein [Methylocystis sp. 9N]|uniref:Hsp20/alpha crystallin family protein n=1 Tax=Methylocystis borbori TaxID=3118750 RepID=A0ABU7XD51_9HYPH